MRSVRLIQRGSSLVEFEAPDRQPGEGEVRVAIRACGICHSDAHYRSGTGTPALPRTLGHEVAGVVAEPGPGVEDLRPGDRVAIHYLVACGVCGRCRRSGEQFCHGGAMIGKDIDGGYAESIVVPARNAVPVPDEVPLDVAAVMMCSTATAYHALRLAGITGGASVLILGFGGLGYSALQLCRALDSGEVTVVDVVPEKLALARSLGARAVDGRASDLESVLRSEDEHDIALDFAGRPEVAMAALRALAPGGRLMCVALSESPIGFNPYRDLLARERRIIGSSDHLRDELVELMQFAAAGRIDLTPVLSKRVPLSATAINAALDDLDRGTAGLRTVIVPDATPA